MGVRGKHNKSSFNALIKNYTISIVEEGDLIHRLTHSASLPAVVRLVLAHIALVELTHLGSSGIPTVRVVSRGNGSIGRGISWRGVS